ncbi:alpha-galactosidase [Sediminibacterium ginsengisoli]|uniref:Alpha-galactosidase n=1 Tax=Sediminibacterium ginsengisoli TaxID=413434 RepID=A0A1T4KWJ0_9BACT|nr:alpha-galactosidase [Sediminibacterium ginsengisoli]SJZ46795.1 alpha-galactosidase [Sediminibacterium ginsengisoli]
MRKPLAFFVCTILCLELIAQNTRQIILETNKTALVLTVGSNQRLVQSYLGKKTDTSVYRQLKTGREVYLTAGMENQNEAAIRVVHGDGNPSLELQYVSHRVSPGDDKNISTTEILLKDPVYPVEVTLYYQLFYNENIIKTWSAIRNLEQKPVQLYQYASSMLHFNAGQYWLTQFHGDWAREVEMVEEQLTPGIKALESKLGTRTNFYQTQTFFVSLNERSTETTGELIAGTLNWTGNFKYSFEIDQRNGLRVISGINPYASEYKLMPSETFTTPEFLFTWSGNGKGEASRNLHQWARNYGVLDGKGNRHILLNNWEATRMAFNENKLVELFDEAKKLGADLFLLDDGWFGNKYPRNDDKTALGDWQEDKLKLPGGIAYLVKEAEQKGIHFGIWLEPEMVSPKSELYEKHPDWILKLPNRPEHYGRNQLVLDLANPKVQDFIYNLVDDMLTRYPGLAFIKWDCNRSMTNAYSTYLGEKQSHLYIEYTRGFYKVMERIRKKYATLPIMLCSGGGGRTDYGAMKYFTEFWPSDNTDPLDRIYIQWGYSYFFPANTITAHITGMGKQPLKFKTDVAMMGKMGYDIRTNTFTPQEMQFSAEAVKTYKRISPVIWYGDQFRLISPYESNRAVLMYVSADKSSAILFNYNLNSSRKDIFGKVLLEGLDARKKYLLKEINLFPGTKSAQADNDKIFTGEYLMQIGLNLSGNRALPQTSNVFELTEQK